MKNALLPIAGGKAFDLVNTIVSGRNQRALQATENQNRNALAKVRVASQAIEAQKQKELAKIKVASQTIEAQTMKRLAQLNVASQVINIAGTIVEGIDRRETLRADIEKRRGEHHQFMQKFDALQTYIHEFQITELPREHQKPFHEAFLELMRRA